jgi:hypothetical protein
MAKSKPTAFPKFIYVTRENAGTQDEYLSANESVDGIEDRVAVAIYELSVTRRKVVTHDLE